MNREALFQSNIAWADAIARNVHRRLPPSFDLDDLIQEARIALWRFIEDKYDPALNDNVQGAAYRVVRGAVLMKCRRGVYREATHDPMPPSAVDSKPNPEEAALDAERRLSDATQTASGLAEVTAMMEQLGPAEQYLLRRIHIDGQDPRELAKVWGSAAVTMARRAASAIRRLKRA